MAMMVSMNSQGRITVPREARQLMGLDGETQFELEFDQNVIQLRPAVVLPREDAWAYTPEHRATLDAAHADSREGRVRTMSRAQLAKLTAAPKI